MALGWSLSSSLWASRGCGRCGVRTGATGIAKATGITARLDSLTSRRFIGVWGSGGNRQPQLDCTKGHVLKANSFCPDGHEIYTGGSGRVPHRGKLQRLRIAVEPRLLGQNPVCDAPEAPQLRARRDRTIRRKACLGRVRPHSNLANLLQRRIALAERPTDGVCNCKRQCRIPQKWPLCHCLLRGLHHKTRKIPGDAARYRPAP